ncbi:hypothetical protein [Halobacillus litoralis]|uniref:hypothetical protein n=1 Tax=Halobacillus litoralis TaxID=45668 RepID=UPI00249245DC|nr:hypothetical protein [Halobacillus litoralis]
MTRLLWGQRHGETPQDEVRGGSPYSPWKASYFVATEDLQLSELCIKEKAE